MADAQFGRWRACASEVTLGTPEVGENAEARFREEARAQTPALSMRLVASLALMILVRGGLSTKATTRRRRAVDIPRTRYRSWPTE